MKRRDGLAEAGTVGFTVRGSRHTMRRSILGTVLAAGLVFALPASASAAEITATTTKGGSCTMETIASRAGSSITFGGRVTACSAKFGIESAQGRGLLYEDIDAVLVDVTPSGPGNAPYEQTKTYAQGDAAEPYRVRWDVRVVLRSRTSASRPKNPERWIDPGAGCYVGTYQHNGDMLTCQVFQDF